MSPAPNHDRSPGPGPRRLIVLGSTGSIGVNTLEVVDHLNRTGGTTLEVVGLAACSNADTLIEQARRFNVRDLAIADEGRANELRRALPDARVRTGETAARQLVEEIEATDVAAAVVGAAGLSATLAAIERGLRVSLSNKETLVAPGELVTPLVRARGATLLPVDSEHSAIFQCLESGCGAWGPGSGASSPRSQTPDPGPQRVKRIVLTASGGPFRTASKAEIADATVADALNHPTWKMGPKITIDSASMMNKALEIIEAHWLFGLPAEQIEVIVHPQSIVHSFVEFADHSVLAQLGPPDMRTPIQYALMYPERPEGCGRTLEWSQLSQLTFEPADFDRFPALKLAYDAIRAGGTAGAVMNAANEAAVEAFLAERIRFGRIPELVAAAMAAIPPGPVDSLATVMEADLAARAHVREEIERGVGV